MKITVTVLQWAVRILAILLIAMGVEFWLGRSFSLLPVHMRMGEVLILLLWILAFLGLGRGVKAGLAIGAIVYGFFTVFFAMYMGNLVPGPAHEAIRVLHLLIGLGALGLAEMIGGRIKRQLTPVGSKTAA
jgi:hypothetical protein